MNDTIKTINSLRTIHGNFSEKEISNEDFKTIIEASLRTANSSSRQAYSLIVIEDKETMKALCGYHGDKAIIFCYDYYRLLKQAEFMGYNNNAKGIIGFVTGATDAILVAQTSVIAAKSLGIDSLITNGLYRKILNKVFKMLNLPKKGLFPLITVIFGYPKIEPDYIKERLNNESIIHYGQYKEPSKEIIKKNIEEYDDHSKHIGLIDNWEELGFKHYLDWYYSKWEKSIPEENKSKDGSVIDKNKEFFDKLIDYEII